LFRLFGTGQMVDEKTMKILRATVQKRVASTVSWANYVARQLHREGIHCNVYSSMDTLPDGFRVVIEFHVAEVDKELLAKFRKPLYNSAFDYTGRGRDLRRAEREIEEGKIEELEQEEMIGEPLVSGDTVVDASEDVRGPEEEGGEGEGVAGGGGSGGSGQGA